jgi:hypothetical protein
MQGLTSDGTRQELEEGSWAAGPVRLLVVCVVAFYLFTGDGVPEVVSVNTWTCQAAGDVVVLVVCW